MDIATDKTDRQRRLESPPPQPPRSRASMSMMDMSDNSQPDNAPLDASNPAIQAMRAMGDAKKSLLRLSSLMPVLAQGIQQIISGLEAVIPQQVADMVSGNPPGSGGSSMGAPQASAAPTAPPVQSGMPSM